MLNNGDKKHLNKSKINPTHIRISRYKKKALQGIFFGKYNGLAKLKCTFYHLNCHYNLLFTQETLREYNTII